VFEPFKLKRALKLGLVALVAGMGASPNINTSIGRMGGVHGSPMGAGVAAAVGAVALLFGLMFTAVGLVLFYFGSRMEFVLFEIIATKETTVAPKWAKYGRKTWPWIGLKLLYLLILVTAVIVAAVPFIVRLVRMPHNGADFDNMQPLAAVHLVLGMLGTMLPMIAVLLVMCIGFLLMLYFVLPVYALEEGSVFDAVGKTFRILCGRFWGTVGYLLMYFVLCIGVAILFALAIAAAVIVAAIPLAPIGFGLYYGLHNAGAGGIFLMVLGYIVEGLIALAWMVVCGLVLIAFTHMFYRAYALYFFGGLYEPLGNLLEPPALPPTGVEAEPPLMA